MRSLVLTLGDPMFDVWKHAQSLGLDPIPARFATWLGQFEWDVLSVKEVFVRHITLCVQLRRGERWTDVLWVFEHVLEASRPSAGGLSAAAAAHLEGDEGLHVPVGALLLTGLQSAIR